MYLFYFRTSAPLLPMSFTRGVGQLQGSLQLQRNGCGERAGTVGDSCASGWCGKVIEGGGTYAIDDYDLAIQRMCVQRGPDDNMDRCADTIYNYKKVYMCFCQGDLCNGASSLSSHTFTLLLLPLLAVVLPLIHRMRIGD